MPRHQLVQTHGLFAQALYDRLEQIRMDLRELAARTDSTYEHMRKMRIGATNPSPLMLKAICQATGLNLEEMRRLVVADQIKSQYGSIPEELAGKDPTMGRIERAWKHLTPDEERVLENLSEVLVKEHPTE